MPGSQLRPPPALLRGISTYYATYFIEYARFLIVQCVQSRAEKIYSSLSERLDCSPNVTSPCWIPAAQSVVPKLAGNLTACRTFDELYCMIRSVKLGTENLSRSDYCKIGLKVFLLLLAKLDWRSPCVRACRETAYKITTRRSSLQPVVQVHYCYVQSLLFYFFPLSIFIKNVLI